MSLRWLRPVIGLASLRATADGAIAESDIRRFTQIWLRPEYGLRLSATWGTPFGEFRQESRVYPADPIRVYPSNSGLSVSPSGLKIKVDQAGRTGGLGPTGELPKGMQLGQPFDLTAYEGDQVVWLAELSRVQNLLLREPIPGNDPVPVNIPLPEGASSDVTVGLMVNGQLLIRNFPYGRELQFTVPAGNSRSVLWIRSGNAEIQPKGPMRMLVSVNFA